MNRGRGGYVTKSRFNAPSGGDFQSDLSPLAQLQTSLQRKPKNNFYETNLQPTRQPPAIALTPDQRAFEAEFSKWEIGFEEWKQSYANHADRNAYRQYEQKFLDVKKKLLAKRAQIYQNTRLEVRLENDFSAASQMAESILQKFADPPPSGFNEGSSIGGRGPFLPLNRPGGNFPNNFAPPNQFGPPMNQFNSPGNSFGGRGPMGWQMGPPGGQKRQFGSPGGPGRPFDPSNNRNNSFSPSGGNFGGWRPFDSPAGPSQFRRTPQADGGGGRSNFGQAFESPEMREKKRNRWNKMQESRDPKEIYPNNPWTCIAQDKPPLVGKRRKVMNAKITKVLGEKEKEAADMMTEVEKFKKMLDEAQKDNGLVRISGAMRRRSMHLKEKDDAEWTEAEKAFNEYFQFAFKKRAESYALSKKSEAESAATAVTGNKNKNLTLTSTKDDEIDVPPQTQATPMES